MSFALPGFFRPLGFNVLQLSPAAAYSLRSLDPALDPTVVNVRRSNDNSTSDFTASEVSDGTLTSWVGGGNNGHVVTWYDQGGTNHATQSTALNQPKIVDGGSLVIEGGHAALDFDGVDDYLQLTSNVFAERLEVGMVSHLVEDNSKFQRLFNLSNGADDDFMAVKANNEQLCLRTRTSQAGTTSKQFGSVINNRNLLYVTSTLSTDSYTASVDGEPLTETTGVVLGSGSFSISTIGARSDLSSSSFCEGTIQEVVIYDNDQSANSAVIEDNINDHFGIFWLIGSNLTSLYVSPNHSADLADILAGTYDFTTVDAIDGTIVVATEEGTYSAGISLNAATTYDLYSQGVSSGHNGFMDTPVGYAIFPSTLSDSEIAQAEATFVAEGAAPRSDFGSVTSFAEAWYNCSSLTSFPAINTSSGTDFYRTWRGCNSLTSFPLINTSSGTSFSNAWRDCDSLTSFPLIDTSSGTNFFAAWYGCSSLTTFPSGFFDSWSPASVSSGVFNAAWDGCTSLTAQSVENILVSLDTSGVYGTNTGLVGGTQLADHTIDIDHVVSTLSPATTAAIISLKAKNWGISLNSVIQ